MYIGIGILQISSIKSNFYFDSFVRPRRNYNYVVLAALQYSQLTVLCNFVQLRFQAIFPLPPLHEERQYKEDRERGIEVEQPLFVTKRSSSFCVTTQRD